MDVKARSKAMREILTRLVERAGGVIKVKVFGEKVILDEGGCGYWKYDTPQAATNAHIL